MIKKYEVPQLVQTAMHQPKNRIWICDVSGSMAPYIQQMAEDLVDQLEKCDPADLLTVLWFSSEGEHGTIIKGARIGSDKQQIAAAIRKQMHARNLTCFSESLMNASFDIDDLAEYKLPVSLMFYSDGYPVVKDYKHEHEMILHASDHLVTLVADALIVGYGDYYNRDLLTEIANAVGGSLVHADNLADFSSSMTSHLETESAPRTKVPIPDSIPWVFGLSTGKVVSYPVMDHVALVNPAETAVYHARATGVNIEDPQLAYAAALIYAQQEQTEVALSILGSIGDVYLVNKLANAFSVSEIGVALSELEAAIFSEKDRFKEGFKKHCLPKRDAFCLIEALEWLEKDVTARFHIDKGFEYKRTGVQTVQIEGYPEFKRNPDQACPVDVIWNSERLNVSLQAVFKGTIDLDAEAADYHLPNPFPCIQFRTFTIIKDGVLNVRVLPVSMSRDTFLLFRGNGLIDVRHQYVEDKVYHLNLTRIPIMNRAMADGLLAGDIARSTLWLLELQARQKVLKKFREALDPEKQQGPSKYSPEQRQYLAKFGISKDDRFTPEVQRLDPTDYYDARTFVVKIAGASSLPTLDEALTRAKELKTLNLAQEKMVLAYNDYVSMLSSGSVTALDEELHRVQSQIDSLRTQVNRARAAIVLGNRWFPEFKSRDQHTLLMSDNSWVAVDDIKGRVPSGTVKVNFEVGSEKVGY